MAKPYLLRCDRPLHPLNSLHTTHFLVYEVRAKYLQYLDVRKHQNQDYDEPRFTTLNL